MQAASLTIKDPSLLRGFIAAVETAGWNLKLSSANNQAPVYCELSKAGRESVYIALGIWKLIRTKTDIFPSGFKLPVEARFYSPNKWPGRVYRNYNTVAIGWCAELGVYAGFATRDLNAQPVANPLFRISKEALIYAGRVGVVAYSESTKFPYSEDYEEFGHNIEAFRYQGDYSPVYDSHSSVDRRGKKVIAFRPDMLSDYLECHDTLHFFSTTHQITALQNNRELSELIDLDVEIELFKAERATKGRKRPRLNNEYEKAQREDIIRRLDDLDHRLLEIQSNLAMLGHNNPPESMKIGLEENQLIDDLRNSVASLNVEINKTKPSLPKIIENATFLSKCSHLMSSARGELVDVLGRVKDKGKAKAADVVVGSIVVGAPLYYETVISFLHRVLEGLSTWFMMLF